MEEYQVITRGRLAGGCSAENVRQNLQDQLGLDISATDKLLSGSAVRIKSRMDWNNAQALRRKLVQLGLQTELAVQFNPACLQAGLSEISEPDKPALTTGKVLIPDSKKISPTLVSFAHTQDITTEQKEVVARLTTFSSYWNPVALLVTCAFLGLTLQGYLLHVLTIHLQQNSLATVAGILFLLMIVACLPRFLQPRQLYSLATADDHQKINVLEKSGLRIGSTTHLFYDDEGNHLATMRHTPKHAEMLCPKGQLLFLWQQRLQVSDSGQDVAGQIRDQLMEDTAFGTTSYYLGHLRNVINFLSRKRQSKAIRSGKARWELDSARPVLDTDQQLASLVYQYPASAIKLLKTDLPIANQLLLLAFCCQLIRRPLA